MPRPIDHRDITLTNPSAETPTLLAISKVDIEVDTRFESDAEHPAAELRFAAQKPPALAGEVTDHEVVVKDTAGIIAARIRWRRTAQSPDPDSAWSQPRLDKREPPPASADPTATTSQALRTWDSARARDVRWSFRLQLWAEATNGHVVTVVDTASTFGVRYSISVTKAATLVFSSTLSVYDMAIYTSRDPPPTI